jgi:hypothetical protein
MLANLERTRAAKVAALRTVVRYELGDGSDDEREEAELALAPEKHYEVGARRKERRKL